MRNSRKKRRRPQLQKQEGTDGGAGREGERIISSLAEAFSSASIEEATATSKEAIGDFDRACETLSGLSDNTVETMSGVSDNGEVQRSCSCSSGSSGLGSTSSDGLREDVNDDVMNGASGSRGFGGTRGKKMVASTGMVSTLLGKDYAAAGSKTDLRKAKGWSNRKTVPEDAEQFLCSLLGDGCDLSMAVVKDVLGHCEYDVDKALDVLLELCPSTSEQCADYKNSSSNFSSREDMECSDNLTDRGYNPINCSSENDVQDQHGAPGYGYRDYLGALRRSSPSSARNSYSEPYEESELPEKVLRSLFHIPESSKHEPGSMNWKNAVKKVESFVQKRVELYPAGTAGTQQINYAKGAEYEAFREPARHHWDFMKGFYEKATRAHSNGAREYASYLSEQGKLHCKLAEKEDEKASMEIFKARNKDKENVLTIDLHGQHVKQAIRLLKLHLLFGTYISSVQYLRVITGCGMQGVGKSKLKESVISLLERETIEWKEDNRGTVLIRLDGQREFSFLDSGSDSD